MWDTCHDKKLKIPEVGLRIRANPDGLTHRRGPFPAVGSFISGFRLVWKFSAELNHYEHEHPISCQADKELGAHFMCQRKYLRPPKYSRLRHQYPPRHLSRCQPHRKRSLTRNPVICRWPRLRLAGMPRGWYCNLRERQQGWEYGLNLRSTSFPQNNTTKRPF